MRRTAVHIYIIISEFNRWCWQVRETETIFEIKFDGFNKTVAVDVFVAYIFWYMRRSIVFSLMLIQYVCFATIFLEKFTSE